VLAVFIGLGGMLLGGLWVGICLGLAGLALLYFFGGGTSTLPSVIIAVWNALFNFAISGLPLYLLLGEVFVVSGLARKSYDAITPLFERVPGKLLVANVCLDAMMGAVVGTSMATAAAVGSIAYPELSRRGYDRKVLVGNLAGAGTLGSYVPPSIGMIVYASWVEISVAGAFAACLFPALITASLFIIFLTIYVRMHPAVVGPPHQTIPFWRALLATRGVWPMLLLITAIMGTILGGIATPTEAAGLGATIAIIMGFSFGTFNLRKLYAGVMTTVRVCGMVFFIVIGASIFAATISVLGLPRHLVVAVQAMELPPLVIILLIYVLYLILGCFFDFFSMLLMTLPFVFPLIISIGADPFWFGAILVVTGECGMITPPVGMNLYVLQGITKGEVSLGEVAMGALPYFFMLLVTLVLVTIFPEIATWLPTQLG